MARSKPLKLWLVSKLKKDAVYEILSYNPDTGDAVLQGKYAVIEQNLDPAKLKQAGYIITKENPNAK